MASQIAAQIGHYGLHGYSAAFDFIEAIDQARSSSQAVVDDDQEPLKILLVGPGDIRHMLATVSRRRRHHKGGNNKLRPIHFYLIENPIEILARELLMLELIVDFEVPIRQRATVFLEIYGNCKIQDRTARYIEQLGHELRLLIAEGKGRLEHVVDLSHLRYRERDGLEDSFKGYSRGVEFDVESLRDHRLRGLYAERYDSRKQLADWDYYQGIKAKASIVHIKQYKEWCHSGIAFEFGDQTYNEPNRTMMSYAEGIMKKGKEKGLKKEVRGFWADVVASPYFTFGVDCETPNKFAEGLYEIFNKNTGTEQHRHHAVEIAMYNMLSYLWEMETGQRYAMTKEHDVYSGLGVEAKLSPLPGVSVDEEGGKDLLEAITEGDEDEEEDKENEGQKEGKEGEGGAVKGEGEGEGKNGGADALPAPPAAAQPPLPPSDPALASTSTPAPALTATTSAIATTSTTTSTTTATPTVTPTLDPSLDEQELHKQIQRAENIAESLQGVSIIPLLGPPSTVLDKPKFTAFFDGAFVSARFAQCLELPYFAAVLNKQALVAVETGKFLVPLNAKIQAEFNKKEDEYAAQQGWRKLAVPPVFRRRRDGSDQEDDVAFYATF